MPLRIFSLFMIDPSRYPPKWLSHPTEWTAVESLFKSFQMIVPKKLMSSNWHSNLHARRWKHPKVLSRMSIHCSIMKPFKKIKFVVFRWTIIVDVLEANSRRDWYNCQRKVFGIFGKHCQKEIICALPVNFAMRDITFHVNKLKNYLQRNEDKRNDNLNRLVRTLVSIWRNVQAHFLQHSIQNAGELFESHPANVKIQYSNQLRSDSYPCYHWRTQVRIGESSFG